MEDTDKTIDGPPGPGYYLARSSGHGHYNLIVQVQGEGPFQVMAWDMYKMELVPISPADIVEWGPWIEEPQ
jgi:hypothetical protein